MHRNKPCECELSELQQGTDHTAEPRAVSLESRKGSWFRRHPRHPPCLNGNECPEGVRLAATTFLFQRIQTPGSKPEGSDNGSFPSTVPVLPSLPTDFADDARLNIGIGGLLIERMLSSPNEYSTRTSRIGMFHGRFATIHS